MGLDLDLDHLFFDIDEEQVCPFHFDIYSSLRIGSNSDINQIGEIVRLEGGFETEDEEECPKIYFKITHSHIKSGKTDRHCYEYTAVHINYIGLLISTKEKKLNDFPDSFCISPELVNLFMFHQDDIRVHVMKNTFKLEMIYHHPFRLDINILY